MKKTLLLLPFLFTHILSAHDGTQVHLSDVEITPQNIDQIQRLSEIKVFDSDSTPSSILILSAVDISPRGTYLTTQMSDVEVVDPLPPLLTLWDVERGERIFDIERSTGALNQIYFTPDESKLVAFAPNSIYVYEIPSGELQHEWRNLQYRSNGIYPNSNFVTFFDDETREFVVWDADTSEALSRTQYTDGINRGIYNAQGTQFAFTDFDGRVLVWDVENAAFRGEPRVVAAPDSGVIRLVYTVDGTHLTLFGSDEFVAVNTSDRLAQRYMFSTYGERN